jgi:DNA-binding response OmpR family regulator
MRDEQMKENDELEQPKIIAVADDQLLALNKTIEIDTQKLSKVLLVDDNEAVRTTLRKVLEYARFRVTTAANVSEALSLINTETFDVLLSDLHMPNAGDGFTVVSAMRHTNPEAVTLVFTGYPALQAAMDAILLQADEILIKPMAIPDLIALIRERLNKRQPRAATIPQRVAAILEREASATINEWLTRVKREDEIVAVPLDNEQRTGHLSRLLEELVARLRVVPQKLGTNHVSSAAVMHGKIRFQQGYSVSMIVEESRILQVSIFDTLQKNLSKVDFSVLLHDVMTIADEVDSQLKQTINSFMGQVPKSILRPSA